jgi:hypothetical protein
MNWENPDVWFTMLIIFAIAAYTLFKVVDTVSYNIARAKEAKYQSFSGQEVVDGFWLEDYTDWLIGNGIIDEAYKTDDLVASYVSEHGDSD